MKNHSPGFLKLAEDARSRVREINAVTAADKLNKGEALLIDVREDHEWGAGHAKGAKHLGRGIIERDIEKEIPDFDQPIICYCGGGYRSAMVVDNLQKIGYRKVWSMTGGWSAWQSEDLPME